MAKTCSICDDPVDARGWCHKHWTRWKKHGDPLYVGKPGPKRRYCEIPGCERPRTATGFCDMHRKRLDKHGDPFTVTCGSGVEWFWSHVDRSGGPDACHPWQRSTDSGGYAATWFDGRSRRGHQVAWELVNGPVPPGLDLDHQCHNLAVLAGTCHRGRCPHRACCNERHIVLRTRPEHSAATPPFIHRRGETHPRARLTEQQVREIRALLDGKTPYRVIAAQYDVAVPTIQSIKSGRNWAWLP